MTEGRTDGETDPSQGGGASSPGQETGLTEKLRFLLSSAHQVRSPLATVHTSLKTLLEGYAGELSGKQRQLLEGAGRKVTVALELVNDMLAMNALTADNALDSFEGLDLNRLVGDVVELIRTTAGEKGVEFIADVPGGLPAVWAHRAGLRAIIYNLLDNAVRYTPRTGRVSLKLAYDSRQGLLKGEVSDTGIGIRQEDRERVFTEFYRAPEARKMIVAGTGLGLAIVRRAVEVHDGSLELTSTPGTQTTFAFKLPLAQVRLETLEDLARSRAHRKRIVIVGGVAAGPKAAAKARRTDPNADITIVERGVFLSYAGCGLPYYVSGQVADQKDLMTSPIGENRDPEFFKLVKDIHVLGAAEAVSIDRRRKELRIRHRGTGAIEKRPYDKLILATGANPVLPEMEGVGKKNVFTLHGVEDAEGLKRELLSGEAKDAAIIGGGRLGIEMAEALTEAGARVTVIEREAQILRMLDVEMAALVRRHLEHKGVRVLTGATTVGIDGDDAAGSVITTDRNVAADLVVIAAGVVPNVELAREAGITIGPAGGIDVNEFLQTNDPDIFAAGDCTEILDLVTGRKVRMSLGSAAHRQGRVAGINAGGGRELFAGCVPTAIIKVFDLNVGASGLTEREARESGFDVETVIVPAPDRAHYYPSSKLLIIKLVADRKDRRLLGAQVVGPGEASKRLDVVTAMLSQRMPVEALARLDHSYAPPYSTALDCITIAANVMRNKLDGAFRGICPVELKRRMDRGDDLLLVDVRTPREYEKECLPGARLIPLASLRSRMNELPREKEIVTVSELGGMAYEAALILQANAFSHVAVLDGGLAAWPYEKMRG